MPQINPILKQSGGGGVTNPVYIRIEKQTKETVIPYPRKQFSRMYSAVGSSMTVYYLDVSPLLKCNIGDFGFNHSEGAPVFGQTGTGPGAAPFQVISETENSFTVQHISSNYYGAILLF